MATLQSGKCFTVPTFFGMCCRSEWQERMYIYKWHEVDQTKHEIFCVHIVCNEIQVKVNLEITTFFFYLRFPYCPNFFWFGVVNYDHSIFFSLYIYIYIDTYIHTYDMIWNSTTVFNIENNKNVDKIDNNNNSAVKWLIVINRIQNKCFCLHNIFLCTVYIYVYINTHTCMYIFKKNVIFVY